MTGEMRVDNLAARLAQLRNASDRLREALKEPLDTLVRVMASDT